MSASANTARREHREIGHYHDFNHRRVVRRVFDVSVRPAEILESGQGRRELAWAIPATLFPAVGREKRDIIQHARQVCAHTAANVRFGQYSQKGAPRDRTLPRLQPPSCRAPRIRCLGPAGGNTRIGPREKGTRVGHPSNSLPGSRPRKARYYPTRAASLRTHGRECPLRPIQPEGSTARSDITTTSTTVVSCAAYSMSRSGRRKYSNRAKGEGNSRGPSQQLSSRQ